MKGKNSKMLKLAAVAIFFLFVMISAAQAVVSTNVERKKTGRLESEKNMSALGDGGGTVFTWEDDFLDTSKIDFKKSFNIDVDTERGVVRMSNTYKAWHYPWPKMKEIRIHNSGGDREDYVLFLEGVSHEPEMEPDYSDIRFVSIYNDVVYDLDYWVGRDYTQYYANIWVRVPFVPHGDSVVYMFYGDKDVAPDHSNFNIIFTWDDRTDPDIMISHKNYLEGAWDPDVAYGGGRFLVAWEERLGPEDLPGYGERAIYSCIHGRTYNSDGGDPQPPPETDTDIDISPPPPDTSYHAENPSIAYGDGVFLVVWEENPANWLDRFKVDIKAALVTPGPPSEVVKRFTICSHSGLQADPCVAFGNNRFFVVWEDARAGTSNYDVWGRIYYSNGNPATDEFQITTRADYQGEPWVAADDQGGFMVVYESGVDPESGPFSLYAQRFDANGIRMMSEKLIASGTSSMDYVFPSVCYNPTNNGRYFVAWNSGDPSQPPNTRERLEGEVWGEMLNTDGSTRYDDFMIQPGDNYIRTDVKPFLGDMFFVSFDKGNEVWGKLVYSPDVSSEEKALSDGSSLNIDWNNLAVDPDNDRIMVVWEDERDQASEYPDAFGSVWHIYKSSGSADINYTFSEPRDLVTEAVLMSKVIPSDDVQEWDRFEAVYDTGYGSIIFDVMDEQGDTVLHRGLGDISNVNVVPIRLRATFSRSTPDVDPFVDKWSVSYIGVDLDPPETLLFKNPEYPDGKNNWYVSPVEIELGGLDDGSGVETIHYIVDDEPEEISYGNRCGFTIYSSGVHTIEYWSVDYAGNEETPHNFERDLKVDTKKPMVEILEPDEFEVPPGDITVKVKIMEKESGIDKVRFYLNGDLEDETMEQKENYYFSFTGSPGMFYTIEVKAYDKAGNYESDSIDIQTTPEERNFDYSPKIGYWYTSADSNDNVILLILSLSLVITDELHVKIKPPDSIGTVDYIKFRITGRVTREGTEYASDKYGYFKYKFDPPTGFYTLSATMYDSNNNQLEKFEWPGKVLFINTL